MRVSILQSVHFSLQVQQVFGSIYVDDALRTAAAIRTAAPFRC